jgi:oligoribonuclease NrnB/cAMP/cGMP phosphodiesterase (DHH superfamily)
MILVEDLEKIRTVITHDNCHDGIASAMIAKEALPKVKVRFVKYNSEEHETLEAEEGMLFCDFSPHLTRTKDFVDVGAIVLDHHAREVVEPFGDKGIFADKDVEPGVSGATLTYRHVFQPLHGDDQLIEKFAHICGIYDTWQTKSPLWETSREYHDALMFYPRDTWFPDQVFPIAYKDQTHWFGRLEIGKILIQKTNEKVKKLLSGAYRAQVGDLRVIMVQGVSTINEVAESAGDEADIFAGFTYYLEDNSEREDWGGGFVRNAKFKVSLRARRGFNVRELALFYGGGGHVGASSFVMPMSEASHNPYVQIMLMIRAWAAQRLSGQ